MADIVGNLAWLLLIAVIVAILARKMRLPYTVGLLVAGVAVAFSPWKPEFQITKDLIFILFLPPLIFEAAFAIHWGKLRKNFPPILTMATVGVLASTSLIYFGMTRMLGWDWRAALMFGTLISATDPVSVIAMLKDAKSEGRFRLVLEAESLFNDGTAAALFAVTLVIVQGGDVSIPEGAVAFLKVAGGGLVCGAVVGAIVLAILGRTHDHLVEITCTFVAAYGAFVLAEHFGFSGVLATLVSGLMLGNLGPMRALTDKGRDDAEALWEFCGFLVNSLLFILMGARLATISYSSVIVAELVAIGLVLLGRALAVYGCMSFFMKSQHAMGFAQQSALVWGGLRGALGLALALGLPADLPRRSDVITAVFAVVAFSTVVQGITMPYVVRRLHGGHSDGAATESN